MSKIDSSLFNAQEHALDKEYRLCPECGGSLSLRKSKHGLFLGCENYPTCQYMRPLQQHSVLTEKVLEDSSCPDCGKPLAIKRGVLGCLLVVPVIQSASILKPIVLYRIWHRNYQFAQVVTTGNYRQKTSRYGKTFYACSDYPNANMLLTINRSLKLARNVDSLY